MTWLRVFAGVLVTLLVLISAAVAALFLLDWNILKPRVESFASAAVGRTVTIGRLHVEPGWTTVVDLSDLRVAKPDWARAGDAEAAEESHEKPEAEPDPDEAAEQAAEAEAEASFDGASLLRTAGLHVTLQIKPLLTGQIVIDEIVVSKPAIDLLRDAEGRATWDLAAPAEAAGELAAPEERDEFPVIGRLQIDDGIFRFRDAERDLDLTGKIQTAEGDAAGSDSLDLALEGSLEGKPLAVKLVSGSVLSLRKSDSPFPVDLDVRLGETAILVKGTMLEPVAFEGLNLALTVKGPDLAETFPLLGIPLPPTPPYSLTGALKRDGDDWRFEGFEGVVGDSDLAGSLRLDQGGEKPHVTAELVSRKLDFDDLAGFIGAPPDPTETASEEQRQEAAAEEADGSIFPDEPIDSERLHAMNMDVHFVGEQVIAETLPIDHLDVTFHLVDGRVEVNPLSLEVAKGKVTGEVALNAREKVPSADADLTFEGLDLKPFFKDTQFIQEMDGRFAGHLYLLGVGESLDAMMQNARGEGWVGMSEGSVSGLLVEAAGLDVVEALALFIGDDARVPIRCARIDLEATLGKVNVKRAIVDTTDSVVLARGEANLAAEELDLEIEARAKDFSLIDMAAPVAVTGTFKDPSISIGGLDPLPFLEMGDTEDVDCARLLSGQFNMEDVDSERGGDKPAPAEGQ